MFEPGSFIPPFNILEHLVGPWRPADAADTAWIVVMGALVAIACGWLGCFLILQGMALIGDAISHTVLLGIVLAFLVTGQVSGIAMFLGAAVTGLLTTLLIEALHSSSRIKEDAAIGIVFTSLFALGVVLLSTLADGVDIDPQHMLYGNLESTPLQQISVGDYRAPIAACRMAPLVLGIGTLILLFYKELQLVAFDPQLAAVMGLRPRLFRYGLMALLSITVVDSFSSVGAILVVAMLIAPAATAFLLTRRLPVMFALVVVVGCLSSLIGYHLAYWLSASAGGGMVTAACGLFGLAFLFSPKEGLVATALRRQRLRWRTHAENVIRVFLRLCEGNTQQTADAAQLQHALQVSRLRVQFTLFRLRFRGWLERAGGTADQYRPNQFRLTAKGLAVADRLDRAHRLWETFLVDQVGIARDHVHPTAEEVEHLLSEQLVENVDKELGHPQLDPHGSPIPRGRSN